MNIVKPSAREMWNYDPQKHIEAIGRICYKSEDKITEVSNQKFITDLRERKHWAMLEHYRFILNLPYHFWQKLREIDEAMTHSYRRFTEDGASADHLLVSASARGFMEAQEYVEANCGHYGLVYDHLVAILAVQKHIVGEMACPQLFNQVGCVQPRFEIWGRDAEILTDHERMVHGWHSVLFTCDRGVTHELVRHRPVSFAQESTRYCNYSLGKFGNAISVIDPCFWDKDTELYGLWEKAMRYDEEIYMQMLHAGATPQQARTILPQSTKADIVLTTTNDEWKHILDLRYTQTTGPAHPQMVEVVTMMVDGCDWAKELTGDAKND